MKETRVPFSGPEILALLDGRKTETRQLIRPQPWQNKFGTWIWKPKGWQKSWCAASAEQLARMMLSPKPSICPYGEAGDIILATETFYVLRELAIPLREPQPIHYAVDVPDRRQVEDYRYVSARFMPKWASRIRREIVKVGAGQLQDITPEQALAEGVEFMPTYLTPQEPMDLVRAFAYYWNSLHPECPWSMNPWVWVVRFKEVQAI